MYTYINAHIYKRFQRIITLTYIYTYIQGMIVKDSSGILLSSIVTAYLIGIKTLHLVIPVSLYGVKSQKSRSGKWEGCSITVMFLSARKCKILGKPRPISFHHVQIFVPPCPDLLTNSVAFHVQLTCNHSNSQLMIVIHHLRYPFDVYFCPANWRSPAPGSYFTFTKSSLNLMYYSQTLGCYRVLSARTCWNISRVYDGRNTSIWFFAQCS